MKIKNLKLKIFFLVLSSIFYLLFSIPTAFAQTPNQYAKHNTNSDVPVNLHNWTQTVMIEVLSAFNCQLTGIDPTHPQKQCLGIDSKTGKIGFVENGSGVLGLMAHGIGLTFIKPMGIGDYTNYLARNFGLGRPVLAAEDTTGKGFSSLAPLADLWVAFRNIVYMLFIIVFVIVGVAIMLRVKIDPRTVMTIENQIPKIIIGLVLVTFSFAIAGFLIDLMWVTIYVTIGVLAQADPKLTTDIYNVAHATNPFHAAGIVGGTSSDNGIRSFIGPPADSIAGIVSDSIEKTPVLRATFSLIGGILAGVVVQVTPINKLFEGVKSIPFFGPIVGGFATAGLTVVMTKQIVGFFSGAIATVVIGIAVLWALFRVWFALLSAYVSILLQVVFAPFWIIGGVIPGSPMGFSGWMRSIVANLLVFPATIGMFVLGKVMMDRFNNIGSALFVPPLVGDPNQGNASGIGSFIGLGILLLTPQVATMIKEAFKAPQLKQATSVGQSIGVGLGAINVLEHAKQVGMYQYYTGGLRNFPLLGSLFGRGEAIKTESGAKH